MTPALSLFYGGMVRKKNILSTTMHSYAAIAVVSIQWILFGYSFVFGGYGPLIGDGSFALLNNVSFAPIDYAPTIPHQLFLMFQLAFAVITPALISGSIAERMKFPAFLAFILLWTTFVYDPIAHWIWGNGGWIRELDALDFAGGSVIHISSGVSALVAAIYIGKRSNHDSIKPHNIPMTMIGAGLLLFGWYGFNAGSALAINDIALNAFIATNTSAAAPGLKLDVLRMVDPQEADRARICQRNCSRARFHHSWCRFRQSVRFPYDRIDRRYRLFLRCHRSEEKNCL